MPRSPLRRFRALSLVGMLGLLVALVPPLPARATMLIVTNLNDMGMGSLREAISLANIVGGDTITFAAGLSAGTISLASTLVLDRSVTIRGAVGISGQNLRRVFTVNNGATVTLDGLSIVSGTSASVEGGGIRNDGGNLTVTNCTLTNNHAGNNGGGAIYHGSGTLSVTNSAFFGNTVGSNGGAIYIASGTAKITNSTFSGNTASAGGAIINNGTLAVVNSTFTGNSGNGQGGGGIANIGDFSIGNALFSANSPASSPDIEILGGTITNRGHNFISNGAGSNPTPMQVYFQNGVNGDQVGTAMAPLDPFLDVARDNGGPTFTYALRPGSPAIDAGDDVICAASTTAMPPGAGGLDGRGQPRTIAAAGVCDLGAFEYQPVTPTLGTLPAVGTAGQVVVISGTGFQRTSTVTVGGVAVPVAVGSVSADGTRLTIAVPGHAAGGVSLVVTNPGTGHSVTGTLLYTVPNAAPTPPRPTTAPTAMTTSQPRATPRPAAPTPTLGTPTPKPAPTRR